MSGEYKIRALGPDKTSQRTILGRFPTKCPDLKSEDEWTLKPEIFKNEISQWTLQNSQSQETYRGNPEGGLTGRKPSNYFLLIRRKGDFVAVPVDQWTTFRPSNRREDISLDAAEAAMKHRRMEAEKLDPISAIAAPDLLQGRDQQDDDESDEEMKKVRGSDAALRMKALENPVNTGKKKQLIVDDDDMGPNHQGTALDFQDEYKPSDAEDWEHEIAADDDDLDMGNGTDEEAGEGMGPGRNGKGPSPSVSVDEGDMSSDGEGLGDSSVRQRMKRVMRQTGLESDEEEASDESDDDDVDALDRMASAELPMLKPQAVGDDMDNEEKKKRKSPPPIDTEHQNAAAKQQDEKRQKSEPATLPISLGTGLPTQEEIKALLDSRGRLLLSDIAAVFRNRLRSAEDRKHFTIRVKAVARLDPDADPNGPKYLISK